MHYSNAIVSCNYVNLMHIDLIMLTTMTTLLHRTQQSPPLELLATHTQKHVTLLPFDNKYKGVSWNPPESIYIVSINDRGKKKKYKITPLEIVCPKASQGLGKVTTPNFFCRYSKTSLGNCLVNISSTYCNVGTNSNFTSHSATFSKVFNHFLHA